MQKINKSISYFILLILAFIWSCDNNIDSEKLLSVEEVYLVKKKYLGTPENNHKLKNFHVIMFEDWYEKDTVKIRSSDSIFMSKVIQTDESTEFADGIGILKTKTMDGIYFDVNQLSSSKIYLDTTYTYVFIHYDSKKKSLLLEYSNVSPVYM